MAITNGYATLTEIKTSLRISDTIDDAQLEMAVEAASRLIDGYAQRYFYPSGTATRVFASDNTYQVVLDDLLTVSQVKLSSLDNGTFDVTLTANDYQLYPLNNVVGGLTGWPFTELVLAGNYLSANYGFTTGSGRANVQITGTWGWSAVPIAVKQATIIQASRIFKRADSPLGVAGFGDMGVMRVSSSLDPDVRQLIDPYRLLRNFQ